MIQRSLIIQVQKTKDRRHAANAVADGKIVCIFPTTFRHPEAAITNAIAVLDLLSDSEVSFQVA